MVLTSSSVLMVDQVPQKWLLPVSIYPGRDPLASLGSSSRSADGSDIGSLQITAFSLSPRAFENLCTHFKCRVSISHSPLALLKVRPVGLQGQIFWGLIFLVLDPQTGELMWGLDPSLLVESLCNCNYLPFCESPTQSYGY